jgi:hypothetical protein
VQAVKTLVQLSARVEAKNAQGATPLHNAAANGHVDALKTLLQLRANIEAKSAARSTPLHSAAFNGHVETLKTLVRLRANIEAKTIAGGMTPLHYATYDGHVQAVKTLVRLSADIEARTAMGGATSLHIAADRGHLEVLKTPAQLSADIHAKNAESVRLSDLGRALSALDVLYRQALGTLLQLEKVEVVHLSVLRAPHRACAPTSAVGGDVSMLRSAVKQPNEENPRCSTPPTSRGLCDWASVHPPPPFSILSAHSLTRGQTPVTRRQQTTRELSASQRPSQTFSGLWLVALPFV